MDRGPPELQALNNDLILESIFKNLSTPTLLRYRLTSKKWSKIASDILKRRPLYVKIQGWRQWSEHNFQQLATTLTSKNFPATGLKIDNRQVIHALENFYAKKFFTDFGPRFTQVYLVNCDVQNRGVLTALLCEYLPKIEVLTLENVYLRGSGGSVELLMPHLRQLCFEVGRISDRDLVVQILRGSPKLKSIYGLPCKDPQILSELLSQKKLGIIKSMSMHQNPAGLSSGIYQSLAPQSPALTEFTWDRDFESPSFSREFKQCITAILIASQNTLKKLRMEVTAVKAVAWEDLPVVFTKLDTMALDCMRNDREESIASPYFSNHKSVKKFPVLKKVCLNNSYSGWTTGTGKLLQRYLCKPGITVTTVDTIELHDYISPDITTYLAQVFPNVTEVILNFLNARFENMDQACFKPSDLWYVRKFLSLRKLVIMDFPTNLHLDSFLTGIPLNICKRLEKGPKGTIESPFDYLFRPYGGLRKLRKTGLRELEIVFSGSDSVHDWYYPIMTQVALWYGLDLISDLQTTLRIPAIRSNRHAGLAQAMKRLLEPHVRVEYR